MMNGKQEHKQVKRHDWWVTPVWEVTTPFDNHFNEVLLQEINDYFSAVPEQHRFNLNIWNCTANNVQQLKTYTLKIIKDLTYQYVSPNYDNFEYWHTRGWINTHVTGVNMPIHGHGGNKIAMTYYVKAPEKCGDLLLIDPRGATDWDMGVELVNGTKYKRITPQQGKLVFFPAYLLHMVEENKSLLPRVSLTSNLATLDKDTIECISDMVNEYNVSKAK